MRVQELSTQVLTVIESLLLIGQRALGLMKSLSLVRAKPVPYSYENLLLDFSLDLQDARGRRALITRKQRVHFLTAEAGVLSSPIWGEGIQLKRYLLDGARRLGIRPDGSRKVLLLGLERPAERDMVTVVVTNQTVANAFLQKREYFEASVERPTRRLSLKAISPKGRPPSDAYLSSSSGRAPERLPVRIGRDGRARISWSVKRPLLDTVYSMRWSW